ncbi:monovalent cation/H(+) antiporter subunit G [Qingshengfaniella alkalisoli]|uniref:Monovalent cation/H(+) antiporter subunit G n=1 Tax=Qingshengfaniella alkalisoli TaxID=2599296 RepID=A0A5B8J6X5_9RHOB|nr:monovalent cation/H(+) antiporter subunit G [Qingshengfaniella alkalisoli]QDY70080.1 monovalent cation/H(+) antiporter subunit G [Qingshengfaniella alkalisoli]
MTDILVAIFVLSGGLFAFVAGLGIARLPNILNRMHSATKAGTLGAGLTLVGTAIYFGEAEVTVRVVAAILFLLLTAPIAAHMIGRATVRRMLQERKNRNEG